MSARNRAAIRLHQCRYWTGFAEPVRCCNSIKESSSTTRVSCDRTAFFCIFRAGNASCLLQFVYAPAREMRDCKGRSRLSARSALQSASRFGVSTGDPRSFDAGFPIGARSIPVGTRFCFAKSSVLYLCFRLTRERGWRRTLRCGRVWQQTLFRGSRTGGFCDVSYSTNAGFLRSKIRLSGKGSRGI